MHNKETKDGEELPIVKAKLHLNTIQLKREREEREEKEMRERKEDMSKKKGDKR